jgi:anti-anti-sigma factor
MQVTIENRSGFSVVHLGVERMADMGTTWVQSVNELLDVPEARIVIDLSAVKSINSSDLGALVTLAARANQYKSKFALAQPSAFIAGVLETTQLNRFFRVFPSVDEAIAGLA